MSSDKNIARRADAQPEIKPKNCADQLAQILKHARSNANISQFKLALELDISQRHVSFVESGRARPSRKLILAWMRQVGASQSIGNAALHIAGFASNDLAPPAHCHDDTGIRAAAARLVHAHDPLPALVFDSQWRILEMSKGGQSLCRLVMPDYPGLTASGRVDMIDACAHPLGLLSRMRDAEKFGVHLLSQLQAERWSNPELASRVVAFEESLHTRFGDLGPSDQNPANPEMSLIFHTDLGSLRFLTFQSILGLPQDTTVHSLRTELWFAGDAQTRAAMERLSHD